MNDLRAAPFAGSPAPDSPVPSPAARVSPASPVRRARSGNARRLFHAAEKGDAGAQFNLGVMYGNCLDDNGHAMAGDRAEAIKWLQRAAKQELPRAQCKLAEVYAGTPEARGNRIRACAWYLRALANLAGMHRENAQAGYEGLAAQMTDGEIETAGRLARAWKHAAQTAVPAGAPPIRARRAR
jgi:TPR repeat protein